MVVKEYYEVVIFRKVRCYTSDFATKMYKLI